MHTSINILELRSRIQQEEFDYLTLTHALRGYSNPRNRITSALRSGEVVRVKKGVYVFGEPLRKAPVSREVLSNQLYGPSYISREFALSWHGMIPEQTPTITAMTTGRSRSFRTPLGLFLYTRLALPAYAAGVSQHGTGSRRFFIASPEKALADTAHCSIGLSLRSKADVRRFLFDDLRIDEESIGKLNPSTLRDIAARPSSRRVEYLTQSLLEILEGEYHE